MRDLTLRSLRIFDAAASTSSFSRAAEMLGMTQSAVSQQIRALEDEVKVKLFDTQARPIRLTDAGRELLRHARLVLSQVNVAMDSLNSLDGQFRGQLQIGAVSPANYFLPAIIAAFRKEYPEMGAKINLGQRDDLLAMLSAHQLDLVISGYPSSETDVQAEVFARHPHCLVASIDHPMASRRNIEWAELRDEPFIAREADSGTRRFLEHLLQVQGLQVNLNLELEGNEAVKQAVMAGLGISFLSAHVFQLELQMGKLAVLDVIGLPKWLDWCVLTRREAEEPAARRALQDFILAEGARIAECRVTAEGP
ncbi:LysR family transcriptional regulator [Piscinibacter gummiphilus]|uniref:LysR family transcriptional regulator n=1 Tax=Piscinibacter gummiphilus TaxID=946333 RepID=A0A1W6L627_9BURK|nr:LysR family transcriptional regulator [Piscinibacter gummiphilus]ARN19588.1 LysR family transcriptional regulator [Piscinibacter gummiphilus]ATU64257.1 LysR family transcriptional regulator [Piscinibacter gummiphilus]GLS93456.1 LysR family transcriptional regulator [Piscinibacter gummiphilus]